MSLQNQIIIIKILVYLEKFMSKCHKPRDREIGQQILKNGNKLLLPSLNFFLGVFRNCSSVVVCIVP